MPPREASSSFRSNLSLSRSHSLKFLGRKLIFFRVLLSMKGLMSFHKKRKTPGGFRSKASPSLSQ